MFYAKLFVAAGILLLAEGTPGPQFKHTGRLNLQYKASDDPYTMHRALQIMNPTPELSGLYRCFVTSFTSEEYQDRKMIIYVPQSDIKFWHTVEAEVKEENAVEEGAPKEAGNIVNVTCAAEGVFPEPTIRIYSESKLISDSSDVKTQLQANGLYDVAASVEIDDDEMTAQDHEFECELNIPEANYTVKRAIYVSLDNLGTTGRLSIWLVLFMLALSMIAPSLM